MDIKFTEIVEKMLSLLESNAPTQWTTQEASERFFDTMILPSSCHHPQPARQRAAAALGRPVAAVSSLAEMVTFQTLGVVSAVVSEVGLVARIWC